MASGPAVAALLALASAVAVVCAGCGASGPALTVPARPSGAPASPVPLGGTGPARPSPAGPGRGTGSQPSTLDGSAGPDLARFCPQSPGPALRAALRTPVPVSLHGETVPLGMSAGGRDAYVSTWQSGFSGVAVLSLATGRLRPIHAFAHPGADQADGSAGGRWLVWEETHSLRSLDGFTVWAWDSVTAKLRRVGHSLAGPHGAPWPSPWHAPAVSGHYAAWAQGYRPGGLVQIRLANLATGRVTVVRRGHVQAPFFDGSLLVWPESDRPGSQTTLHAVSARTGRAAALPAVLRPVHGTDFVVTDGTRTAYLSPDLTALYYSAAQDRPARQVLRLAGGTDFASLTMAPGSLAWATTQATYVASTSTGGFARATPEYGVATGSPAALLISDAPAGKSAHPVLPLHVVKPGALDQRAC